jgi:hypothetical protein
MCARGLGGGKRKVENALDMRLRVRRECAFEVEEEWST